MRVLPLILSLFALLAPQARAEDVIVGVTSTARPFVEQDADGTLVGGFNVELGRLLCQRMGRVCAIEAASFPHLLTAIEEGTFQVGIANLLKTPEREARMLFSAPIWRSTTSFVARAGTPSVEPARALARHRVCVVRKSQQEAFVAAQSGPAANLVPLASYGDLFAALTGRRCDIALIPTVNALTFLGSPAGAEFDYSGPPLTEPGLSGNVHIVVTKGRPELLQAIDAAIADIQRDGSYRRLIARHFPFDIL